MPETTTVVLHRKLSVIVFWLTFTQLQLIRWLTDWLVADLLTDLLTSLLTNLLTNIIDWLTDWLTVAERLLDFLVSSLTNWLDWLADILRFMLRKGINYNAFMMWIKITAITDQNDWFFISDQICPADVSRRQQPGFWAYLQYCKCFVDCFVILLLSESDKLKFCSLFKVG